MLEKFLYLLTAQAAGPAQDTKESSCKKERISEYLKEFPLTPTGNGASPQNTSENAIKNDGTPRSKDALETSV